MELMGHWHPGVMSGLAANGTGLGNDLGWFPFPLTAGGQGNAYSALGGGDGFSCSADAPPECVDFLKYILSVDVQTDYAATGAGLPVTQGSEAGVSDPNMAALLAVRNKAPYVQLWLDVAYGSTVGGALNDAIANAVRRHRVGRRRRRRDERRCRRLSAARPRRPVRRSAGTPSAG